MTTRRREEGAGARVGRKKNEKNVDLFPERREGGRKEEGGEGERCIYTYLCTEASWRKRWRGEWQG